MIPIRDTAPCNSTPWVSRGLIVLCAAIFLVMNLMPLQLSNRLMFDYGMVPLRYSHPEAWAQAYGLGFDAYFSFISNLFIHSGWLHLIVNCWFLWIFADNVEDRMGPVRFLIFYLLCGIFATFLQWFFDPELAIPVVGASGAIAGVLAAYFFLYPYASVIVVFPPFVNSLPAVIFLGLWVIFQLYNAASAMVFPDAASTVAWWAHLGGFIAGSLLYRWFIKQGDGQPQDN